MVQSPVELIGMVFALWSMPLRLPPAAPTCPDDPVY